MNLPLNVAQILKIQVLHLEHTTEKEHASERYGGKKFELSKWKLENEREKLQMVKGKLKHERERLQKHTELAKLGKSRFRTCQQRYCIVYTK